jgi:hypothetical protein
MTDSAGNGAPHPTDLTAAVSIARRGFRSDVRVFTEALDRGELFAPLAAKVKDAVYGEQMQVEDELRLTPHLLEDPEGKLYCALFTRPELIEPLEEQLGWTTDGDALEYCALPARAALDMVLQVIDDDHVLGLVINPLADTELVLRRSEVASIAQGEPIPLVGYVEQIPEEADQRTLLAEPADPPPPEFTAALEQAIAKQPQIQGYTLQRTFNRERDLEPHLTLTLRTPPGVDRQQLAAEVMQAIEDKLPPPGYIDVLFQES